MRRARPSSFLRGLQGIHCAPNRICRHAQHASFSMIDEAPESVLRQPFHIPDDPPGARSINAAIVGIPNAGKSVMLNYLVDSKVRWIRFVYSHG
jgi:predicted GTPase